MTVFNKKYVGSTEKKKLRAVFRFDPTIKVGKLRAHLKVWICLRFQAHVEFQTTLQFTDLPFLRFPSHTFFFFFFQEALHITPQSALNRVRSVSKITLRYLKKANNKPKCFAIKKWGEN